MLAKLLIAIAVVIYGVNGAFPDDPKPCKHGDEKCIANVIEYFAREKAAGDAAANVVPFDPLDIPLLNLTRGDDSPVHISLIMTDGKGYGLKTAKVLKTSGFGKEVGGKNEVVAHVDYLSLLADYTINGQILILPIRGKGKTNITMIEPKLTIGWNAVPYEKDGATYLKPDKYFVDLDPKGIIFNFENLFNDKALSDNMNKFLTDNWKDVYPELRGSLGHGLALVSRKVISKFFGKSPYNKLVLD